MSLPRTPHRESLASWAASALIALAAIGVMVHLSAVSLHDVARDSSRPFPIRAGAAERAVALEPWNDGFALTAAIVEAQGLLGQGKVDEAYFLLLRYSRTVHGDALYRETYQAAVAEKWVLDARKAHVQHGREKKGGVLEPEDVLR
jgi:hypothetical protein